MWNWQIFEYILTVSRFTKNKDMILGIIWEIAVYKKNLQFMTEMTKTFRVRTSLIYFWSVLFFFFSLSSLRDLWPLPTLHSFLALIARTVQIFPIISCNVSQLVSYYVPLCTDKFKGTVSWDWDGLKLSWLDSALPVCWPHFIYLFIFRLYML